MELCPSCQRSAGRSWWLSEGDVYCGLCGRPVRDVSVHPPGSPGAAAPYAAPHAAAAPRAPGAATPGMTWLVGASADGPAAAALVVTNTGTLAVRVSAIDAPAAPACRVAFSGQELQRGDAAPVSVSLSGAPAGYPRELELIVRGNFPPKTVRLAVAPAPARFLARPAAGDEWSRRAAEGAGTSAAVGGALRVTPAGPAADDPASDGPASNGGASAKPVRLAWELSEPGELILTPDSAGRAALEVLPEGRAWEERELPAVAPGTVRWLGLGAVEVTPAAAPVPARPAGGAHAAEATPIRLALKAAAPLTEDLAGTVVFELDALGRPQVRVPIRLAPGRPEWRCEIEQFRQETLTLPYGCPSVLYFRCTPLAPTAPFATTGGGADATAAALAALIDEYRLEVTAAGPAGSGPPTKVRVQQLGRPLARGAAAGELRYRVTVTPPPRAGAIELSARLVALMSGKRAELSPPRVLNVNAVDVRDPKVADPKMGYRLVVDFGTTYTCIGRADPHGSLNQCQPLREGRGALSSAAGAGDKHPQDMIPTELWLKETETAGEPQCLIGMDVENRGPPAGGARVFRLFKPDIADETPHEVPTPAGGRRVYHARDFVFMFLRELLTEARAQLGHATVQDFYVTCPATFNARQRHELHAIVTRLKAFGVTREADLLLDEANAGAFRDLDRYLTDVPSPPPHVDAMIFDFGGGTIDIAALRCTKREAPGEPRPSGSGSPHDDPLAHARGSSDATAPEGDAFHPGPSPGRQVYDLAPLGISGLRDFGGKHVTDALARLLARRLAAHLYGARPRDGRAVEPLMRMAKPPWLPLPASIMPGFVGQPAHVQELAEENLAFLHAVAEDVKTLFYGAWPASLKRGDRIHIPGNDPGWYDKLDPVLTNDVLDRISAGHIGARFRLYDEPASRKAGEAPQERIVRPAEWRKWLADCAVTRAEIDELIAPALEEAFGRARRVWNSARAASDPGSLTAPYAPPDLFLLAGGSSQLPLVWKLAEREGEQNLGFPAHRIAFSQDEAKRKVALGGALYARVRKMEADVAIKPEDTLQFLLIPIVYEIQARRYQRIFPTGYRVTDQGTPQPWPHVPDDGGELDLLIYENVDYRDGPWELPKKLQDLKMHARGKEPLAQFKLHFSGPGRQQVVYRILRAGLVRKITVRYTGRDGEPRVEEEPI